MSSIVDENHPRAVIPTSGRFASGRAGSGIALVPNRFYFEVPEGTDEFEFVCGWNDRRDYQVAGLRVVDPNGDEAAPIVPNYLEILDGITVTIEVPPGTAGDRPWALEPTFGETLFHFNGIPGLLSTSPDGLFNPADDEVPPIP